MAKDYSTLMTRKCFLFIHIGYWVFVSYAKKLFFNYSWQHMMLSNDRPVKLWDRAVVRRSWVATLCLLLWCKSLGLGCVCMAFPTILPGLGAVHWPSATDASKLFVCSKHISRESKENWKMLEFSLVHQCSLRLVSDQTFFWCIIIFKYLYIIDTFIVCA